MQRQAVKQHLAAPCQTRLNLVGAVYCVAANLSPPSPGKTQKKCDDNCQRASMCTAYPYLDPQGRLPRMTVKATASVASAALGNACSWRNGPESLDAPDA